LNFGWQRMVALAGAKRFQAGNATGKRGVAQAVLRLSVAAALWAAHRAWHSEAATKTAMRSCGLSRFLTISTFSTDKAEEEVKVEEEHGPKQ
jgi:hypothetical protein